MRIQLKKLRSMVRQELEEAGKLAKGLATLATMGAIATTTPNVSAKSTKTPGTHAEIPEVRKEYSRREIRKIIQQASTRYGVEFSLLNAIARTESNYDPYAESHVGAMGVMQLMPDTASYLGVDDPFDPRQNVMGGAKYIARLLKYFDGDIRLAIAAYNAGPAAVKKHGDVPPYEETQKYVARVLERMEEQS